METRGRQLPGVMLRQAVLLLGLALAVSLAVNGLRADGLRLARPAPAKDSGAVSLDEARRMQASGQAVFVDARSDYEFEQGRIAGAVNLPLSQYDNFLEEIRERLGKAPVLITYCDGEKCPLSTQVAELLRASGYSDVRVLKNGWSLWRDAGLPVEHGAPEGSAWK